MTTTRINYYDAISCKHVGSHAYRRLTLELEILMRKKKKKYVQQQYLCGRHGGFYVGYIAVKREPDGFVFWFFAYRKRKSIDSTDPNVDPARVDRFTRDIHWNP